MTGSISLMERIAAGRTDLVFAHIEQGGAADARDLSGTSLIEWCSYYGDVSAVRFLLAHGALLRSMGDDLGLNAASFHGHWRLAEYLVEAGADPNRALEATLETPLHSALCSERPEGTLVVKVLLARGANPNCATALGAQTGSFMRDCRTRGETPLHRAAAFGEAEAIRLLIAAGAKIDARDAHGDTPLSWASWHRRAPEVLRLLCYGDFRISVDYGGGLAANLRGHPRG